MRVVGFLSVFGLMALAAGCLSSAPPPPKSWMVPGGAVGVKPSAEPKSLFAATRLGGISVLAPYDQTAFSILREDGSLAFDPANRFAAPPAALLKGPIMDCLAADNRFGNIVPQNSIAAADVVVEVVVPELALDCRKSGTRMARAQVQLNVVKNGRQREMAFTGKGSAEVDAASGDYSAAFGTAVNQAVGNALSELK